MQLASPAVRAQAAAVLPAFGVASRAAEQAELISLLSNDEVDQSGTLHPCQDEGPDAHQCYVACFG
jgi:hypothetical protein